MWQDQDHPIHFCYLYSQTWEHCYQPTGVLEKEAERGMRREECRCYPVHDMIYIVTFAMLAPQDRYRHVESL
jgi:hypothetical protein